MFFACVCSDALADHGRTSGNFEVSSSGAATYSIPIWTPPGPAGLTPAISLDYSSQGDNGLAGVGWNVSAAREISRCERTRHQDGNPGGIELSANDRFCIGGNRLRLISGTYGAANSVYYTEIADYSRITAYGTAGNGPAYFIVEAKSGLKYEYGATTSSRVLLGSTALRWMLNKVYDRSNSNNYSITYNNATGFAVPDNISWTPTSQGAATYKYEAKFNYDTNRVDKDSYIGKVAGYDLVNRYRLTSIQIRNSGAVIRKYRLTYNTSTVTSRSRLDTVKECADDAETNCLLTTTFGYQIGQAGITGGAGLTPAGSSNGLVQGRYDLNGDGRDDILYLSAGTCYAAFGASVGFSGPFSVGTNSCGIVDKFLPKGRDAILLPGTPARVAYWNDATSSFTTANMTFNLATSPAPTSADYDGDGLADVVQISPSWMAIVTRRNTSTGSGAPSFSSTTLTSADLGGQPNITWGGVFPRFPNGLQRADFNGDGTQDLNGYYVINTGWSVINYYVKLFGSNSGYTMVQPFDLGSTAVSFPSLDFNDDECTDILVGSNIQIAPCNNAGASTVAVPATPLVMLDWDGDRRTDILFNNGGNFGVYLSTGAGFYGPIATSIPSTGSFYGVDVDGDRMDDMIKPNGMGAISYWTHTPSGLAPANATNVPDLLNSVTDGFGVNYTPSYISTAWGNYNSGDVPVYPLQYTIAHLVVAQVTASNGIGGTYNKTYQYVGARFHADRGDAGFQRVDVTDGRNGLISRTYFDQSFPKLGMVTQTELMQPDGTTPINRTVFANNYATLSSTAYNQRYFLVTDQSTATEYEVGGTWNGNLLRTVVTANVYETTGGTLYDRTVTTTEPASGANGTTAGGVWTARTYLPLASLLNDTANWCLGRPQQTQQINSSNLTYGSAITRTTNATWNAPACRPTQFIVEPGSGTLQVTTDLGYDGFGNVNSTTVTGVGMPARTTTAAYTDATYTTGQFPLSMTNALGQTAYTAWNYDFGVPASATDPNGISTSWQYDAFGRRIRQNNADGTYVQWQYFNCATFGLCSPTVKTFAMWTHRDSGGARVGGDHAVMLDAFDRLTVLLDPTFGNPTNFSYDVTTQYDALGRVARQSIPKMSKSSVVYWTDFGYDLLNRTTSVSRPISDSNSAPQTTTISYQGLSTVATDPQGKQTRRVVNAAGDISRAQDHDLYAQTFDYDASGNIKRVQDSAGNTLRTSDYNIRGMLSGWSDMDRGTWTYNPNALGEVVNIRDAKTSAPSWTQTFGYDSLGRMTSRQEAEGTSTWTWGVPGDNTANNKYVGRLKSVTAPGYSESYVYDQLARASQTTISADATYQINYAYNAKGQLQSVTYPTSTNGCRFTLQYSYSWEFLNSLSNASNVAQCGSTGEVYWTANEGNGFGQIIRETLGNGLVTNRSHDLVTGWLRSTQTGAGGGTGLQNLAYEWDLVGNLKKRRDLNQGTLNEEFFYDNLYRLDYSQRNGVTNLDMAYDATGNITSKSDVGTYGYDATRKHQVVQVDRPSPSPDWSFAYDSNGNMTSGRGSNISWTSFNYPLCIRTGSACSGTTTDWARFSYTPDRRYWRQESNYTSGGTATTIYVGSILEKVTGGGNTDFRHMIRAGGSTIVVSRSTSGTNSVSYVTSDHLGSSSAITNSSGGILVNSSFDAFGKRRGSNWSGNPSAADWTAIAGSTRRGYTGHTMVDNLNLIHMNGRVYDPLIGRFLSADPLIGDPLKTQGYNRYSYVVNNPLTYSDPTGFVPTWVCYAYFDIRSFIVPGGASIRGEGGTTSVIGVGSAAFPVAHCSTFDLPDPADFPPQIPNEPQTPDSNQGVVGWLAASKKTFDDTPARRQAIEDLMTESSDKKAKAVKDGTWTDADEAGYQAEQKILRDELTKLGVPPKTDPAAKPPAADTPPPALPDLPPEEDLFKKKMKSDADQAEKDARADWYEHERKEAEKRAADARFREDWKEEKKQKDIACKNLEAWNEVRGTPIPGYCPK